MHAAPPPPSGPPAGPEQRCHRCQGVFPLRGRVLPWCPRCGGVLSTPGAVPRWRTRWVAHPPPRPRPARTGSTVLGPTPRYAAVPRWGLGNERWRHPLELVDVAPPSAAVRARALAASARPLLVGAAAAHTAAVLAELVRYALLVRGRTELLPSSTVALSDSAVLVTGVLGPVVSVVAAVTVVLWLVRARVAAAERAGQRESRRPRAVVLGALLPVVSLAQAGVLVTELGRSLDLEPRTVRVWWASWVASGVLAVLPWLWRLQDTVQAQADAVLLGALSAAAAAVTAVLTLRLVRRCTDVLGGVSRRSSRRWVASVPALR